MPSIYIAGPMTGYKNFNFEEFNSKAEELRAQGWTVFNPAEKEAEKSLHPDAIETGNTAISIENGFDFRSVYLWDIEKVIYADAIYMLDGWEESLGAIGEHAVAQTIRKHYPDYQIIYQNERQASTQPIKIMKGFSHSR